MIKIVLDALIPGDSKLKMPSASEIDFHAYEIKYEIKQIAIDFLYELTKISLNYLTIFDSKFYLFFQQNLLILMQLHKIL